MHTVNNRFASILCMTWWVLMLRGVLAIIFGVLTWREPELSVTLLIVFFGAYQGRVRPRILSARMNSEGGASCP